MLLCLNPLLPIIARLLASGAFRDYSSFDELTRIRPTTEEPVSLHWKTELLDSPFFKSYSNEEKIETASSFSHRHRDLGIRVGYVDPPTIHDFRREVLYWIGMDAPHQF